MSPSPNMSFLLEEWVYSVKVFYSILFYKQVIPYHVNLEQTSTLTITLPNENILMYDQTKPKITHQLLCTPSPTKDEVIGESPVLNAFILVRP